MSIVAFPISHNRPQPDVREPFLLVQRHRVQDGLGGVRHVAHRSLKYYLRQEKCLLA